MIRSLGITLVLTLLAGGNVANAQTSPSPVSLPNPLASSPHPVSPNECFSLYPFGQVSINIHSPSSGTFFAPGDVLSFAGNIVNPSHAVLPNGQVLLRILREDDRVAEQHWHPIVDEVVTKGINVPANGEAEFTSSWHVPAFAPPGKYRAEFSFLAADSSPIVGISYVPNVSGQTVPFTILDGGKSSAVTFDRAKTTFNGAPFVFRAVPPRTSLDTPLKIQAVLRTDAAQDMPITVEKRLYEWADVEGDTLRTEESESLVIPTGTDRPVTFSWNDPKPGVYELVLRAVPDDRHILPSILRVRFYYEGTVPRILHVGAREEKDGSGTAGVCFFNSTFGPEGGAGTLTVTSNGKEIHRADIANVVKESMATFTIPADVFRKTFSLRAETRDLEGNVTDTEEVTFVRASESAGNTASPERERRTLLVIAVLMIVFIAALGALILLRRQHRP